LNGRPAPRNLGVRAHLHAGPARTRPGPGERALLDVGREISLECLAPRLEGGEVRGVQLDEVVVGYLQPHWANLAVLLHGALDGPSQGDGLQAWPKQSPRRRFESLL